ncbi:alpha/beta fold hydrolase [Pelagibius litoralis]|uniref:Alpha/beta fold hydrolase n=1 Tax=Pelagibius litoralis TaxID=374515 RepID=A0A967EVE9_9PROT|nr:alpha/beta fold hydrolase [Pelagibius litoralis]NIA68571.1 alpha/beta fold hydrolase [Pelagibius litoralis]
MSENTRLPDFLTDGPASAALTFVFAHGAGAPMDTPFMTFFAEGLAARGWRVMRFEFPYMARRREDGRKRPPDRMPALLESWRQVIEAMGPEKLVIGGKSMGGRMASLIAAETAVKGLACLGYPFHPAGRPERLRTEHLADLATPTLILQGTRDTLGNQTEVAGYDLSPNIRLHWAEDGDHDLKPRKASGRSQAQNWQEALAALDSFLQNLTNE